MRHRLRERNRRLNAWFEAHTGVFLITYFVFVAGALLVVPPSDDVLTVLILASASVTGVGLGRQILRRRKGLPPPDSLWDKIPGPSKDPDDYR